MYYFVIFFIVYVLGIIFNVYFSFISILVFAIIIATANSIINKKHIFSMLIILFIILSFVTINYNSKSHLIQYLNGEVEIIANIVGVRSNNEDSKYIGYDACVINVNGSDTKEKVIFYIDKKESIDLNSTIKTTVSVSEIMGNKNRMLYNYKNSLRADKIFVTLFCNETVEIIEKEYSKLNALSVYSKEKIENLFRRYLSDENANTVLSVILGDTKYLEKDFYKNIQKTGLAHVFAVSGMHIVLIYSAFLKFFTCIGISRRIAWLLSWCLLWIYGFVIGFPVTVLRSLLMFNFLFGSEVLYRKYNSINSLVVSAIILLIINPYYLFDVGFQLSYIAALCLVFYTQIIKIKFKIENKILDSFILYVFIQIFTLPVMSYYFNYISVIGIIFNILIVPVFSGIIILAFTVLPISIISVYTIIMPLRLLDYLLNSINYFINFGAQLNIAGFEIASMTVQQGIYYYIFIAAVLYMLSLEMPQYKRLVFMSFGIFYFINLILMPLRFNGLKLNVIDVGQGLFLSLNCGNYNLIFDAGSNSDDIGKYVAVPYLLKHGVRNIDGIFVSHFHADHYSGVNDIIDNCSVKRVFGSSEDRENLINKKCVVMNANQNIKLSDSLNIRVIWPDKEYSSENENNMSNVYLVEYGKTKILIAGDIESEVEELILDRLCDVDILIVPHHGSSTSSGQKMLDKIRPEIAVFSYGKNNYGIPGKDVAERYKTINSKVLSTFTDGEINIVVIDDKIYYNTYTGVNSENMDAIYVYNLILNLMAFAVIVFGVFAYVGYENRLDCTRIM